MTTQQFEEMMDLLGCILAELMARNERDHIYTDQNDECFRMKS